MPAEHTAQMVDTFLRIVGIGFIQSAIHAICLACAALIVLFIARATSRKRT